MSTKQHVLRNKTCTSTDHDFRSPFEYALRIINELTKQKVRKVNMYIITRNDLMQEKSFIFSCMELMNIRPIRQSTNS